MYTRKQRQRLKTENAKRPQKLTEVPRDMWPDDGNTDRTKVWMSRDYLVQEFNESNTIRLSVNRTEMMANGRWDDKLTWDELQEIKRQLGYGDSYAIEVYPKDKDVVNVANMRHLWVLDSPLAIGWNRAL